jgi:hypothetical protein
VGKKNISAHANFERIDNAFYDHMSAPMAVEQTRLLLLGSPTREETASERCRRTASKTEATSARRSSNLLICLW